MQSEAKEEGKMNIGPLLQNAVGSLVEQEDTRFCRRMLVWDGSSKENPGNVIPHDWNCCC